ncbi:sensor domain-containing diguanylate cyclase [Thalassotalea sp. PP2-459]|uniref:sensor domain-containing diguanylate cyclase n=1 Tax=Thalassotalea sp. PP2-459 TaxID=1742724 RepID=UPI0020C9601F|nr:sensor domain-containing diguanylate cyclase [Thalassotalea sp. PP2-459]
MTKNNKPLSSIAQQVMLLSEVLNNVGACIFAKDLNGKYLYANDMVLELFDTTLENVVGKDDSHFFDLSISHQLKKNDKKVFNEGVIVEQEETNYVKSRGEFRIYHSVKKPLYDEERNIIGLCGISTDITEQKRLEGLVKKQKDLLNIVLDNVDAHIYMKDNQRTFKYVNSRVAALFGLPAEEVVGKKETDILPEEVAEHFYQSDKKLFETGERQTIDETVIDDDGNEHHYLSVKIPYYPEGEAPVLIGFSTEVTELYKLKEQFRKQANTDSLTNLFNRRYFVEHAEREFKRAQRNGKPLTVISIDIDHFKDINDQYGHQAGDEVLITVSKHLLPNLRSEDVLARIGGEEFAIVLPDTNLEQAKHIAERIRQQQDSIRLTGHWQGELNVQVSVGVAIMLNDDSTFDMLFSRADKALYMAKNNGRNQVYCFS